MLRLKLEAIIHCKQNEYICTRYSCQHFNASIPPLFNEQKIYWRKFTDHFSNVILGPVENQLVTNTPLEARIKLHLLLKSGESRHNAMVSHASAYGIEMLDETPLNQER